MFCIKSACQVPHPTQLTLLFCLKKVLAAVRGEVAVVQRTSWQDPSQWTDRAKRKNWRSFRGRCWLNKILWLMQHTFSVGRLKSIKKSWTVSESNTSLAWTHWKRESEQGFELEILLSHSVEHVIRRIVVSYGLLLVMNIHKVFVFCSYPLIAWILDEHSQKYILSGCLQNNCKRKHFSQTPRMGHFRGWSVRFSQKSYHKNVHHACVHHSNCGCQVTRGASCVYTHICIIQFLESACSSQASKYRIIDVVVSQWVWSVP